MAKINSVDPSRGEISRPYDGSGYRETYKHENPNRSTPEKLPILPAAVFQHGGISKSSRTKVILIGRFARD